MSRYEQDTQLALAAHPSRDPGYSWHASWRSPSPDPVTIARSWPSRGVGSKAWRTPLDPEKWRHLVGS